jgi:hypothetical protein
MTFLFVIEPSHVPRSFLIIHSKLGYPEDLRVVPGVRGVSPPTGPATIVKEVSL